VEQVERS